MSKEQAVREAFAKQLIEVPPGFYQMPTDERAAVVEQLYERLSTGTTQQQQLAERLRPPEPGRTWERRTKLPAVGFLAVTYGSIGGTETWHRTLLPRLEGVEVLGFVSTWRDGGDVSLLGCPTGRGIEDAKTLAASADVLVEWGVSEIRSILPDPPPRLVSLHHGDVNCEWSKAIVDARLKLPDLWACVNPDVAADLQQRGEPAIWMPNAVTGDVIVRVDKPPGKTVLWLGRFSTEKRPFLALEIAREMPGVSFRLVGEGPQGAALRAVAATVENVEVLPPVPSPWEELSRADVLLNTSDQEGFGLSMAEAMLAGVAVVAGPVGIAADARLAEVVADGDGLGQWVEVIDRTLLRPDHEKMQRARLHVQQNHDVHQIARQWSMLLTELAETRA